MNQPVKVTDKEGKVTGMQYDAMGNLCCVTASEGVKNTFINYGYVADQGLCFADGYKWH